MPIKALKLMGHLLVIGTKKVVRTAGKVIAAGGRDLKKIPKVVVAVLRAVIRKFT